MKALRAIALAALAGVMALPSLAPAEARQVTVVIKPKNEKKANALQKGLRFLLAVQERRNRARIDQRGRNNTSQVTQSGSGNRAGVFQRGSGHTATVDQSGDNNFLGLFQFGRNADARAVQTGNEKAIVIQRGW